MKKTFRMKGICAACGSVMELSGMRDAPPLPEFSIELLRQEFETIRRSKGLTFRQAESECGISNAFLWQFESGNAKDMSVTNYLKLRKWIGDQ